MQHILEPENTVPLKVLENIEIFLKKHIECFIKIKLIYFTSNISTQISITNFKITKNRQ